MKKRTDITIKVRDGWIDQWKKKNAQGNGYYSFITTQDIKSEGSKNRSPDFEHPHRDRNFLSLNESFFYLMLLFDPRITSIKEQYPLLEVERTQYIAKELGLKHPTYPYSRNVPVVMTSDFFCETIFRKQVVYSVKDERAFVEDELKVKYQKNQVIEKTFWESQGTNWHLIRSDQIKNIFSENLEKIIVDLRLNDELTLMFNQWIMFVMSHWLKFNIEPITHLFDKTVSLFDVSYEQATSLFQHAIWHRFLKVDLRKRLNYRYSLSDLGASLNV
jgi:hypothetical protein